MAKPFSAHEIILGNTILVKLELWESVMVMVIIIFGLPLTYAYATLRQSVAGNSTFRGIVFCNLGIPKTVISPRGKLRPHIFPHMVTPTIFLGTKNRPRNKVEVTNVLIPWYQVISRSLVLVFFGGGRYCNRSLPTPGLRSTVGDIYGM